MLDAAELVGGVGDVPSIRGEPGGNLVPRTVGDGAAGLRVPHAVDIDVRAVDGGSVPLADQNPLSVGKEPDFDLTPGTVQEHFFDPGAVGGTPV